MRWRAAAGAENGSCEYKIRERLCDGQGPGPPPSYAAKHQFIFPQSN